MEPDGNRALLRREPVGNVSLPVGGSDNLTSAVSAGLANFIISPSPMVGIHTCDDWYAGDRQNESSESGAQMETFTRNAAVVVAGANGPGTELVPVHVSVN